MDAQAIPWASFPIWGGIALVAYFLGTTPTAYLSVKLLKGQDIRRIGDGHVGASNVSHVLGVKGGIAIAIVDICKGAVVVLLAGSFFDSPVAELIAGIFVIVGHNWPVYLQCRGGRGAATAVGVLMVVVPLVAIPLAIPTLVVLYLTRSTIKALAIYYSPLPFLALWPAGYPLYLVAYSLAIPIFVGISHYLSVKRGPLPAPDIGAT